VTCHGIAELVFGDRWEASGAAEGANYQLFLCEHCDVLGVTRPEPEQTATTLKAMLRVW
jgi:hypothetical protein